MEPFPRDDETAAFGRQATQLKAAGDWDGAITCLRAQVERMLVSPVHYPVEQWCRLGLVLQQAGRYKEAVEHFEWLLEDLPRRARAEAFMDDPSRSFGKTSKKSICNQIVKYQTEQIHYNAALAATREERRLAKLAKKRDDGGS